MNNISMISLYISPIRQLITQPLFFLYLGPETIVPLTSICAGLVGFVLIFWRWILSIGRTGYRKLQRLVYGEPNQADEQVPLDDLEDDLQS